jgi:hypothetical protein
MMLVMIKVYMITAVIRIQLCVTGGVALNKRGADGGKRDRGGEAKRSWAAVYRQRQFSDVSFPT